MLRQLSKYYPIFIGRSCNVVGDMLAAEKMMTGHRRYSGSVRDSTDDPKIGRATPSVTYSVYVSDWSNEWETIFYFYLMRASIVYCTFDFANTRIHT